MLCQVREHRVSGDEIERRIGKRRRRQRIDLVESAIGKRRSAHLDEHRIDIDALEVTAADNPSGRSAGSVPIRSRNPGAAFSVQRPPELGRILLDDCRIRLRAAPVTGIADTALWCRRETRHANAIDDRFIDAAHEQIDPGVVAQPENRATGSSPDCERPKSLNTGGRLRREVLSEGCVPLAAVSRARSASTIMSPAARNHIRRPAERRARLCESPIR